MKLIIEQVSIGYSGLCLLSDLSFSLKAGHALTITGPNGIGKSTCLATVAGLLSPLQGIILNQFTSMAYLPITKPIHSALTAGENLKYWAALARCTQQSVSQALSYFKLDVLQHEPCEHLSAGQQQRLHLSSLLLNHASLWMLDEPYHSLDDEGVSLLDQLIRKHLQAEGAVLIAQTMAPAIGRELNLTQSLRAA
jgi:heme exporter protein A